MNAPQTRQARVRAILPEENPNTRTRTVRFVPAFEVGDTRLAGGQSVTVQVPVGVRRDVLSVHKDAIVRQGAQAWSTSTTTARPRSARCSSASRSATGSRWSTGSRPAT